MWVNKTDTHTVNRVCSFKTCLHPGSIFLLVLRLHHHFQHPADIRRVSDMHYVSQTYKYIGMSFAVIKCFYYIPSAIRYRQHENNKVLFCRLMANWVRSGPHFGIKLNGQGVEANFDLFRETFVLFDLDIDFVFTTEVTILADQSVQATPTICITVFSNRDDGLLSRVDKEETSCFQLFTRCCTLHDAHQSAMFYGDTRAGYLQTWWNNWYSEIIQCILSKATANTEEYFKNIQSRIIISGPVLAQTP